MLNQVSLIDLSRPQRPLPSPRSLARANGEDRRLCRADELSPKRQASAKITSCSLVICLAVPINRGINSLSTSRQALHRPNPLFDVATLILNSRVFRSAAVLLPPCAHSTLSRACSVAPSPRPSPEGRGSKTKSRPRRGQPQKTRDNQTLLPLGEGGR